MPVETFTTIDSLDPTNPPASDGMVQGDDHIRGIKSTIKTTWPNINAVVNVTDEQLNALASGFVSVVDGDGTTPAIHFNTNTALGLYKYDAGTTGFTGGVHVNGTFSAASVSGNGACEPGQIADFLNFAAPAGWAEANGQAISRASNPILFGRIGTTFGVGDGSTTFNLPNLNDRYLRARGAYGAGTFQADTIKSHTAGISGTTSDHTHSVSVTANPDTRGGVLRESGITTVSAQVTTAAHGAPQLGTYGNTDAGGLADSVAIGTSGGLVVSGTATYTGATETMPQTFVVVRCIKLG